MITEALSNQGCSPSSTLQVDTCAGRPPKNDNAKWPEPYQCTIRVVLSAVTGYCRPSMSSLHKDRTKISLIGILTYNMPLLVGDQCHW